MRFNIRSFGRALGDHCIESCSGRFRLYQMVFGNPFQITLFGMYQGASTTVVLLEGLGKLRKLSDLIGTRIHNLPAYSIARLCYRMAPGITGSTQPREYN
jgi:hypothetical protein